MSSIYTCYNSLRKQINHEEFLYALERKDKGVVVKWRVAISWVYVLQYKPSHSTHEAHVFDEEKWPHKAHNIQILQPAQKLFVDFVSFSQVKWSLDYQVYHQNLTISMTSRNPLEI